MQISHFLACGMDGSRDPIKSWRQVTNGGKPRARGALGTVYLNVPAFLRKIQLFLVTSRDFLCWRTLRRPFWSPASLLTEPLGTKINLFSDSSANSLRSYKETILDVIFDC